MQYDIQQKIVETENRINYLVGRFPQPVERSQDSFDSVIPQAVYGGMPSELLENRPDIKQAEYELAAAKLDIKVAKARFYPSLDLSAGAGYRLLIRCISSNLSRFCFLLQENLQHL